MIYTASGIGMWNYPYPDESGLTPPDLVMTEATPTHWQVEFGEGDVRLSYRVDGSFYYAKDVVGLDVGEATQYMTGSYTQTTVRVDVDGSAPELDINRFEPPLPMRPFGQTDIDPTVEHWSNLYAGNDLFIGDRIKRFSDEVMGYGGDDRFIMTYGRGSPERFRGGEGLDSVVIESESTYFSIEATDRIPDRLTGSFDLAGFKLTDVRFVSEASFGDTGHILEIAEVERIEFTDLTRAFDTDVGDAAGSAYRLYNAAFGRTPDLEGLGYWIQSLDLGASLHEIAQSFLDSDEFKALYGENLSDTAFVQALYVNTLDRAPDAEGLDYWVNDLATNPDMTRAGVLASFTESAENVTNTESLMTLGVSFIPYEDAILG